MPTRFHPVNNQAEVRHAWETSHCAPLLHSSRLSINNSCSVSGLPADDDDDDDDDGDGLFSVSPAGGQPTVVFCSQVVKYHPPTSLLFQTLLV